MLVDLNFWKSVEMDELLCLVADEDNTKFVARTLRRLTPDPVWTNRIINDIESDRIGLHCFMSWLARELQPKAYLEVGVRRGFSMAMTAARCPTADIYGFDLWIRNYAAVSNPGPRFVQAELAAVGYKKKIHFINGNSHRTLPAFFNSRRADYFERIRLSLKRKQRPSTFDLILVDGDHSLLGAYQDLVDIMPSCSIGGVVVFDDIAPNLAGLDIEAVKREWGADPFGWGDLLGVWRAVQKEFQNFRYFECMQPPPGIGLAVRLT